MYRKNKIIKLSNYQNIFIFFNIKILYATRTKNSRI
jgi:hypothetical protein